MIPACLLLLASSSGLLIDEAPTPRTLAETLEAIKKQHKEAEEAYFKVLRELPDTEEGNKQAETLWKAFDKEQAERFMKAVEIAKSEKSSGTGLDALEWILTTPGPTTSRPGSRR